MTVTAHVLEHESPTDELAMLLVGEKKSGKSWLANTAPGTLFNIDFDQRLSALRTHPNKKNIFGLTFADDQSANKVPTAFTELQEVLAKLEKSPMLCDLNTSFAGIKRPIDTLIYDSVQTMSDSARRYVLYHGGDGEGGLAKAFAIGGRVYRVAKSFHAWGGEMEMVTGAILQGRALLHCKKCWQSVTYRKGSDGIGITTHSDPKITDHPPEPKAMNVIVTLHEAMEQDERSTLENPIYTGKIEIFPRRYHTLLVYFNEVWRLTRETGRTPTLQIDPNGKFIQAATALGVPSKIEGVPDIQNILKLARNGGAK